jgi:hypothetical protein
MTRLRIPALAALTTLILLAPGSALAAKRARRPAPAKCTGSTPCRACKNCRYCRHCAKDGGKCGVCRRRGAKSPENWRMAEHGH